MKRAGVREKKWGPAGSEVEIRRVGFGGGALFQGWRKVNGRWSFVTHSSRYEDVVDTL